MKNEKIIIKKSRQEKNESKKYFHQNYNPKDKRQ